MDKILIFIAHNRKTLAGVVLGLIIGFIHWYYLGCYWGTYPLSSECGVNCSYGAIIGGLFACLMNTKEV